MKESIGSNEPADEKFITVKAIVSKEEPKTITVAYTPIEVEQKEQVIKVEVTPSKGGAQ